MYKDKEKQREAGKERQRRYKARHKGVTSEGVTVKALPNVIPCNNPLQEFEDMHQGLPSSVPRLKRGKDIKVFADLPLDVQQTIDSMSMVDGKIDNTVKANRTAIAIHYQHLFPDRYYNPGLSRTSSTKGARL